MTSGITTYGLDVDDNYVHVSFDVVSLLTRFPVKDSLKYRRALLNNCLVLWSASTKKSENLEKGPVKISSRAFFDHPKIAQPFVHIIILPWEKHFMKSSHFCMFLL